MTDAEKKLWYRIRGRQLHNTQFYRQFSIGGYIVDFYAASAKLVIELDGGQHFEEDHMKKDKIRDEYLFKRNLKVLRFDNCYVLNNTDDVVEYIYNELSVPPSKKGV